jgi:hypothetical protein
VLAVLTKKMAGCDFSHFDLQDLEAGYRQRFLRMQRCFFWQLDSGM